MVEEYPYNEITEELEDAQIEDQVEKQVEAQQEVYDDTSPVLKEKDDLYSLFWRVVKTTDSSKVGNLDKTELGMLNISVRDCQKIALLAVTLKHPGFAKFFLKQAEVILATSASKKGWLPELFVSQKKLTTKARELRQQVALTPTRKKKGLFGSRR
jgi:hypothetical protein